MKLLFVLTSLLLLFSCKKHKQPEMAELNENCNCATEVAADFVMEEKTTPNPNFVKYTSTDTIFADKNVRFRATVEADEYTWYIGAEIIHDQEVSRFFGSDLTGQTIPVTLVVKKLPNTICLPNDDGYDSIVKYLSIRQSWDDIDDPLGDSTFMEGTYRLKSPLLSDSIDITVDYRHYFSSGKHIDIYNYDGQGSNCTSTIEMNYFNYREFWMDDSYTTINTCDDMKGSCRILLDGTAEFYFTTGKYVNGAWNETYYDWQYRGRKLP